MATSITAGELIVESLVANGINRVFSVPGESYLGLMDALYQRDDIDSVVCHHEAGAGFMALADARLTGKPGVACVSRGPGASNAAIAVHTAQQDGVPMILFIGQVPVENVRRDSFQEIDYRAMFGSMAKWTAEVTDPARMAETMLRAIRVATTGLPGPVVIALPEDILSQACELVTVMPQPPVLAAPTRDSIDQFRAMLDGAERPLILAGSAIHSADDRASLLRLMEDWQIPAIVSFRRQDLLPNRHKLYAGDLGQSNTREQLELFHQADLLIVLGARLSDITTKGYRFPQLVRPLQKMVHVHPDPTVSGIHFAADLSIASSTGEFMNAVGEPTAGLPDRTDWCQGLRANYEAIAAVKRFDVSDGVAFESVVHQIGQALPPDGIITVDAGTFGIPVYRVVPFTPPQRLLSPISGAMGFGVPAAVAAALREPDRTVVCLVGDGGFLMTGGELAVAMERRLPIKVVVSVNHTFASIRIQQEIHYPGRVIGTSFDAPDFVHLGKAYGFPVTEITRDEQVTEVAGLISAPGPQFIVVHSSVDAVLPPRSK